MGNTLSINRLEVRHIDNVTVPNEMYVSVYDDTYSFIGPINKVTDKEQEIEEQITVLPNNNKELFLAIYLHAKRWEGSGDDLGNGGGQSLDFVLDIDSFSEVEIRGNEHNMEEINKWIEELPED